MNRFMRIFAALSVTGLLLCALAGCAPTPDDAQIQAAVRVSLADEACAPELVFGDMEVPSRSHGRANAVLWTADKALQRNYALAYDKKTQSFAVSGYTTSRLSGDGTYSSVPNDGRYRETEYAALFDFTADFNQRYVLVYAGEGGSLSELRAAFEARTLPDVDAAVLERFEVCDLGGDTLVLFVPRYEDTAVSINAIEYSGDTMSSGEELGRFGDKPLYIYCCFDDRYPRYEIHFSLYEKEHFFTAREQLFEQAED